MLVFAQFKCQSEKIQPSASKWKKFWFFQGLFQLHFLDQYTKQKIAKYMWEQSLFKKPNFKLQTYILAIKIRHFG